MTRIPAIPLQCSSAENNPSRARSEVGLVPCPGGTLNRRPLAWPAMILVTRPVYGGRSGTRRNRRPESRPRRAGRAIADDPPTNDH